MKFRSTFRILFTSGEVLRFTGQVRVPAPGLVGLYRNGQALRLIKSGEIESVQRV